MKKILLNSKEWPKKSSITGVGKTIASGAIFSIINLWIQWNPIKIPTHCI